ncbi:MAG: fibronectin type III domain-containing protein [Clostridia bacterium]|nr:fibronectin type III domain-containing protein [Clostridia bacterium]
MKRLLCTLLTALMIIGCQGILLTASAQSAALEVRCLTVQPGSDVTSLNFNWITPAAPYESVVEIAPASEDFDTAKRMVVGTYAQTAFYQTTADGETVHSISNKVTVTDLEPNTKYNYRVGDGALWSEMHTIRTGRTDRTTAYIVSDVHIISSEVGLGLQDTIDDWDKTLNQLKDLYEADLILSIGDQMQNATRLDYLEGFFHHPLLSEFMLAPIDGNHDVSPASTNWPSFVNVPNPTAGGSKNGVGDYFFKQGNILFVMLSLTDVNFNDGTHEKVFKEAIKAYPEYDWMVVCLHESIYGLYMYQQTNMGSASAEEHHERVYGPYIEVIEKYGADVVLTGHAHNYARSHFMKDGEIQEVEQDEDGAYIDPNGTVWVEMGSSHRTGQWVVGQSAKPKFPWSWLDYYYSEKIGVNSYALLETYGNALTLTGYKLLEEDEVLDTLTIVKSGAGLNKGDTPSKEEQTDTPTPPVDQVDPPTETPDAPSEPVPSAMRGTLWIVLGCISAAAVGVLAYAALLLAKSKKNA